jgi:hypothetical protein
MLNLKKIRKVTNRLGEETGKFGVAIFHKSMKEEEAKKIQKNHCMSVVRHYGIPFAKEVYRNIYTIMTNINTKRQKERKPPVLFFTDGMDEYFNKLGITPYD